MFNRPLTVFENTNPFSEEYNTDPFQRYSQTPTKRNSTNGGGGGGSGVSASAAWKYNEHYKNNSKAPVVDPWDNEPTIQNNNRSKGVADPWDDIEVQENKPGFVGTNRNKPQWPQQQQHQQHRQNYERQHLNFGQRDNERRNKYPASFDSGNDYGQRGGNDFSYTSPHPPPHHHHNHDNNGDGGFRRKSRQFQEREPPEPSNVLAVFGLNLETQQMDLKNFFSKYGRVLKANLPGPFDPVTNIKLHRGFGFVTMDSLETAIEAIKDAQGKEIKGRAIRVDFSDNKCPGGDGSTSSGSHDRVGSMHDNRGRGRRRGRGFGLARGGRYSDHNGGREDFHQNRNSRSNRFEPYQPRHGNNENRGGGTGGGGDRALQHYGSPPMRENRGFNSHDQHNHRPSPRFRSLSPRGIRRGGHSEGLARHENGFGGHGIRRGGFPESSPFRHENRFGGRGGGRGGCTPSWERGHSSFGLPPP
ncbi:hypothetical protein H4219_003996 [Mycoemilia scoparia]|uniref:RRM domain-containing protein n=1 Tax=Mycoemilia scoparia TaxID=417184 RepID=A0A9W8A2K4_9FUNG|nr:hypothetical protein H4219_003996 [Mycoemilia scoparia]